MRVDSIQEGRETNKARQKCRKGGGLSPVQVEEEGLRTTGSPAESWIIPAAHSSQ